MRLIVTRVQPQAQAWVQAFLDSGREALALPLIEVTAVATQAEICAVASAWQHWADYVGVMFVSGPAVHCFFSLKPPEEPAIKALEAIKTRAWGTGPGTRSALLAQGVAPELIDSPAPESGQFDSEALWQQVQAWIKPGKRVLIVRGNTVAAENLGDADRSQGVGRDWFAQQVRASGGSVDFVVAYQRAAPRWSEPERALAIAAANAGSVWIFSSTEAISNLQVLLPGQDWTHTRAVATHPRIAQAARDLGFAAVSESRPTLAGVLSSIESLS